jgi:hypothetical protein
MIKQYQTSLASQGFPFRGNPKHVVIHTLERTLANYNEASFSMAKNDLKHFIMQNDNCRLNHNMLTSI